MRADLLIGALMVALAPTLARDVAAQDYGIGRAATQAEIAAWDIDVAPDGTGLPPGHGSVQDGRVLFAERCAACHGAQGQGKPMDALAGGFGTLNSAKPTKTVGSYWPYPTTLYDFIRRAMPFDAPQSLSPDQVYAASAYVLYLNHLVPEDTVLDATTLAKVVMPNRDHFRNAYAAGRDHAAPQNAPAPK